MIKTILLTGSNGFIGSNLLEELVDRKYKVLACVRKNSDMSRILHLKNSITIVNLDRDLNTIFSDNNIDCVIHVATKYIKAHTTLAEIDQMNEANISFPARLCELCIKHKIKYYINTGTFFEFLQKSEPLNETDVKVPYNYYAATKLSFLELLKFYSNIGLTVVDLKLFAPYGEKDNDKLINLLIKLIISGDKSEFSGGSQEWCFTYVKDIVNSYLLVLENLSKFVGFTSFNVGERKTFSIKEIAKIIERISGKKGNIMWGTKPYLSNEIMKVSCDYSKIKENLGWSPEYSINKGLENTYNYYLKRNYDK